MEPRTDFEEELQARLQSLEDEGLYRRLRRIESAQAPHLTLAGKPVLNFSSNDYLGLADAPALKEAACREVREYGVGSGAARLVSGSLAPHERLEEEIAAFKGTETALVFSSGYMTAVGTITALVGSGDVVIIDKRAHASIVDGARLSGAKIRAFAHNNLDDLERILQWVDTRHRKEVPGSRARALIVTESVFSMDGDTAAPRELVELKERYGAWLMIDEAHATGLYGENRRGLLEVEEVGDRVEVQMGTLGKAIGASGGYISGSRRLIDYLVNRARPFMFSTAPVPASSAAAAEGIRTIRSADGEERCRTLWDRVSRLAAELREIQAERSAVGEESWDGDSSPGRDGADDDNLTGRRVPSPILPLIVGREGEAVRLSDRLLQEGIFVPAIRYPTVRRGEARLRFTVSARHTIDDVHTLIRGIKNAVKETRKAP